MESRTIYEFQKNSAEKVRAEFTNFRDREVFNLRVFYNASINGREDWRPTKKGICFQVSLLPELKKAVDLACSLYGSNTDGDSKNVSPQQ